MRSLALSFVAILCTLGFSACVSIVPPPETSNPLVISVPKDWRGLYKVKSGEPMEPEVVAAVEAAIIRHYALIPDGPKVTGVIIVRWGIDEVHEDRLVLRGRPHLAYRSRVAVHPLIELPGRRPPQPGRINLVVKFEDQ